MKTTFPRILATTALCLAAVGLSSCMRTGESMLSHANWYQAIVTTEYEQHNDNKGKDDASMEFKVPVYQVGNKYYVQGEKAVLHYRIGKLLVFPDELLNDRYVYAAPNGDKAYYEVEFQESTNEKLCLFAEDLSTPPTRFAERKSKGNRVLCDAGLSQSSGFR